jgi:hypothetical protein
VDGTTLQKDVLFVRENLVNQSIPGLSAAKPAGAGT